jgi:hypothetical protein
MSTVGNLQPENEFMHWATDDPSFSERPMFNFFDAGAVRRIRAHRQSRQRRSGGDDVLRLQPKCELLMQWAKPPIDANGGFDTAGLRFEILEPGKRLSVAYDGLAVRPSKTLEMKDPARRCATIRRCQ